MNKATSMYSVVKSVLRPLVKGLYGIQLHGLDLLPSTGPVIIAANHVSFLDSVMIPISIPRPMVYLAKSEYFESWKSAWIFKGLGMIPIRRNDGDDARSALDAAAGVLEAGGVLGVYPEGTRSIDGRLYKGRTGVARLALRSGAPVVPVGIAGSMQIMPKRARFPKPWGRLTVRFGQPLTFSPQEPTGAALRTITDQIMFTIMSLSGQEYVDRYAAVAPVGSQPSDFRIPTDEMLG